MLEVEGTSPCHCDAPTTAAAAAAAAAAATAARGIHRLSCEGSRAEVEDQLLAGLLSSSSSCHGSDVFVDRCTISGSRGIREMNGARVPSSCRLESSIMSRITESGCEVSDGDAGSQFHPTGFPRDQAADSPSHSPLNCQPNPAGTGTGTGTHSEVEEHLVGSTVSRSAELPGFVGEEASQEEKDGKASASPSKEQAGAGTGVSSTRQMRSRSECKGVPLFVMLPLDVVTREGELRNPKAIGVALQALKSAGVEGVMVDVWWGLVEKEGPQKYNWTPYQALLQLVKKTGLLLQAVMSFHACGNNVGDTTYTPLPAWVHKCAKEDPAIFFRDRAGNTNPECISFFSDEIPCLAGRTPLQVYEDFMRGFKEAMGEDMTSHVCEVAVGMGPCGELRYPSYPEGDGRWRFPGIGEFQCYDERALVCLKAAAEASGEPNWGLAGPHDAGQYNSQPHQTGFFRHPGGSWETPYGRFFLQWYSEALIAHQERMLKAAIRAFHGASPGQDLPAPTDKTVLPPLTYCPSEGNVHLSMKCAGIHWWYRSASHAAELTAGYYNPRGRSGYERVLQVCRQYGVGLIFTCVEMRNAEQPPEAHCGPEELLKQVRVCAAKHDVPFAGENALPRLDQTAYEQIMRSATARTITLMEISQDAVRESRHSGGSVKPVDYDVPLMSSVTFLRLTPQLFEEYNFARFMRFVSRLRDGGQQREGVLEVELGSRVRSLDSAAEHGGRSSSHGSLGLAVEPQRSPVGPYRGSFSSNSSPRGYSASRNLAGMGSAEFPHYPYHGQVTHHQRHVYAGQHASHYSPFHNGGGSHLQYHSLSPTHHSAITDSNEHDRRALSPMYLVHGRLNGQYTAHVPPGHPEQLHHDSRYHRK